MKELYTEIDNGIKSAVYYDEDKEAYFEHYSGICNAQLAANKYMQDNTSSWRKFAMGDEMQPVLDMTMVDVMKFKHNHGIDIISGPVDWKEVFKLVDTLYPYMKTTTAKLA